MKLEILKDKIEKYKTKQGGYLWKEILKDNDLIDQINNIIPYDIHIKGKKFIIDNNLEFKDIKCCTKECNNPRDFNYNKNKFNKYCSRECSLLSKGKNISESLKNRTLENKQISNDKRKETNLKKYGFECQFEGLEKKIKKTNLEKYGVDNPFKSKDIQNKCSWTNLMKNNPEEFKEKSTSSLLEKYGIQNASQQNIKNYDKWNNKEFIQDNFITEENECKFKKMQEFFNCSKEAIKNNLSRLGLQYKYKYQIKGVHNPNQMHFKNYDKWNNKEFIQKEFFTIEDECNFKKMQEFFNCSNEAIKNNLSRLGLQYKYKYQIKGVHNPNQDHFDNYDKWNNKEFIQKEFIIKNSSKFLITKFQEFFNCSTSKAYSKIKELGIQFKSTNKSNYEYEIIEYIQKISKDIQIIHSDRDLINPQEIDILIPSKNFGIEFDGLMFHSTGKSQYSMFNNYFEEREFKNKHKNKTEECENKKFQLFHIFENEWLDQIKQNIWKNIIANKLGLSKRIFARKCKIKEVQNKEAKIFEDSNHLQGSGNAKIKLGLYYEDELVSLMTFGKSRFNKNIEYELIRFCSKKELTVVGGASKLLKYFERNYNPESLISYANRRWSSLNGNDGNNLYTRLEFKYNGATQPNYFYFHINNPDKLYSRNSFQKHKLKDKLKVFDENLTETENMYNNGYRKIYDSGNYSFIKKYN